MRLIPIVLLVLLHGFCPANEAEGISCRCIGLGTANLPPLVNLSPKGAEVVLAIPVNSLSPAITCYTTGGSIKFLSAATRQIEATAVIPGKMKDVILVFVLAPKDHESTGWSVHVIDDSARSFQDGGVLVANFFTKDIRYTVGERTLTIHPNDSGSFAMPGNRDDFNMAPVSIKLVDGETVSNLSESMLRFLPESRYVILASSDAASGRPRIISFRIPDEELPDLRALRTVSLASTGSKHHQSHSLWRHSAIGDGQQLQEGDLSNPIESGFGDRIIKFFRRHRHRNQRPMPWKRHILTTTGKRTRHQKTALGQSVRPVIRTHWEYC